MGQDRVREALGRIRREDFLPRRQRRFAGQDRALSIGLGQTNSQPTTVLNLLSLLEVEVGHRVLDVGSGSGWTTALLGSLVGSTGTVYGVELVAELAAWGQQNLDNYRMPWASIQQADPEVLGLPVSSPFDRILVSAEAGALPTSLVDQLAVGGLMVIPVAGVMTSIRRTTAEPTVLRHGLYSFVPLIEPDVGQAGLEQS